MGVDKQAQELTELVSAEATDILPVVDDPSGTPVTKKITIQNLAAAIFGAVQSTTTSALEDGENAINTSGKIAGKIVFNSTDDKIYRAQGAAFDDVWVSVDGVTTVTPVLPLSGGTITESGGYRIHTFTSDGTLTINQDTSVEYLLVGGGGSGGNSAFSTASGGGGGAGKVATGSTTVLASTGTLAITVGQGGAAVPSGNTEGNDGTASSIGAVASAGGGGGGGLPGSNGRSAANGGGGGGSTTAANGGSGTDGNAGGSAYNSASSAERAGGGGGSTAAVGGAGTLGVAGIGGAATANAYSGSSVSYGKGGDGHGPNIPSANGSNGANPGDGGQGGRGGTSGSGANGIVIIRYAI